MIDHVVFAEEVEIITAALYGDNQLDEEYPNLFNKVYSYYVGKGIQFPGDPDDVYELLIQQLDKEIPEDVDTYA